MQQETSTEHQSDSGLDDTLERGAKPKLPDDLNEALRAAEAKAKEHWELFLRAKADLDNVQRRARLDVENAHKYGVERFARELLLVLDTFEMGIQAVNADSASKSIQEGVELTYKLLLDTLDKFGVKQLNPEGEIFNPSFHEALSMQEIQLMEAAEPSVRDNQILNVAQKGYLLHERLLRPARVIIAKLATSQ